MKKILPFVVLMTFISCIACHKEQQGVALRVQNTTSTTFTDVSCYGTGFGSVDALATTSYQMFPQVIAAPAATVVKGTDTLRIGTYYIDLPSYIKTGKYTLQIFADTALYYGYGCRFVEESQ